MRNKTIKLELDKKSIEAINYIHSSYFFGMFIITGIAKDEKEEYLLRDAIEKFYKATKEK